MLHHCALIKVTSYEHLNINAFSQKVMAYLAMAHPNNGYKDVHHGETRMKICIFLLLNYGMYDNFLYVKSFL